MIVSRKTSHSRSRAYRQCTRCVMDTSDPEITFSDDGYCCHCSGFLEKRSRNGYHGPESDARLDQMVEDIKRSGRGRPYDCVIGVSGGADSSYLAYLVQQWGLRALAVHMDNGWDSEKAVSNIRKVVDRLGLDYESYVLDWGEFRDLQLAFLRASVPEAETPTDVAIPAALHHFAAKYNVKYVLSGGNVATEGILPRSWHYDAKDLKYFNHIQRTFGTRRLKRFPTFGYRKEMYYKLIKGVRTAYPLDHVPFAKDLAVALLTEKFGWKDYGGKHHESRYTKFIQSYYLYKKFKIDYRRVGLSMMICDGRASRGSAVEQLGRSPYDPAEVEEDKHYIAKKLGVSRTELQEIVNLPPRWYWDLPNDEAKLALIYNTYRRIYNKEKRNSGRIIETKPPESLLATAVQSTAHGDRRPSSVSVIIPTYNYGRFIAEAIQSVVEQTSRPGELIVVDDGSTDDTESVVRQFGDQVRYIKQENRGVSAARNRGVAESSGEFVAFFDADDTWEPKKIEKQLAVFENDSEVGLVHCGMNEFDDETRVSIGAEVGGMEGWVADEMLVSERTVIVGPGGTIMLKREAFDFAAGFDERLTIGEDWDLCYRIARRFKVGYVPEMLVNYRNHGAAAHHNVFEMERSTKIAWQKAFDTDSASILRLRRRSYGNLYKVLAGSYLHAGQYGGFVRNLAKSLWFRPSYLGYYVSIAAGRAKRNK